MTADEGRVALRNKWGNRRRSRCLRRVRALSQGLAGSGGWHGVPWGWYTLMRVLPLLLVVLLLAVWPVATAAAVGLEGLWETADLSAVASDAGTVEELNRIVQSCSVHLDQCLVASELLCAVSAVRAGLDARMCALATDVLDASGRSDLARRTARMLLRQYPQNMDLMRMKGRVCSGAERARALYIVARSDPKLNDQVVLDLMKAESHHLAYALLRPLVDSREAELFPSRVGLLTTAYLSASRGALWDAAAEVAVQLSETLLSVGSLQLRAEAGCLRSLYLDFFKQIPAPHIHEFKLPAELTPHAALAASLAAVRLNSAFAARVELAPLPFRIGLFYSQGWTKVFPIPRLLQGWLPFLTGAHVACFAMADRDGLEPARMAHTFCHSYRWIQPSEDAAAVYGAARCDGD